MQKKNSHHICQRQRWQTWNCMVYTLTTHPDSFIACFCSIQNGLLNLTGMDEVLNMNVNGCGRPSPSSLSSENHWKSKRCKWFTELAHACSKSIFIWVHVTSRCTTKHGKVFRPALHCRNKRLELLADILTQTIQKKSRYWKKCCRTRVSKILQPHTIFTLA
jgi:hypothetical protein